jgi:plastocyanin
VALLVGVLLVVTGCSSADGDEPAARRSASDAATPSTSEAPRADPTAAPPAAAPPPSAPPAPTGPAPTATVVMVGFAYEMPASVPTGAQVTVVNRDVEAHTFSLRGRSERLVVPPKGSMSFTAPVEPGAYEVVCEFHGGMTTSLVVA